MKTLGKAVIRECIGWSNCFLHRQELQDKLTIFIYHDVSDDPSPFSKKYNMNVNPELFDFQIGFLKKHFNLISADDLLKGTIPERAGMVTFDDGLSGYFKHAVPILTKHRVPSLSFMNMATVNGEILWAAVLTYLADRSDFLQFFKERKGAVPRGRSIHSSIDKSLVREFFQTTGLQLDPEIREFTGRIASAEEMHEADENPYVFFGNHLDNHYVSLLLSDQELVTSFQKNQQALEKYSSSMKIFSFPFGQPGIHFEQRQARLLLENGADKVFFSSGRVNDDSSQDILDRVPLFLSEKTAGKMWFRIFRMRKTENPMD